MKASHNADLNVLLCLTSTQHPLEGPGQVEGGNTVAVSPLSDSRVLLSVAARDLGESHAGIFESFSIYTLETICITSKADSRDYNARQN